MSWKNLTFDIVDMFRRLSHADIDGWAPEIKPARITIPDTGTGYRCRTCANELGRPSGSFPFCGAPCAHVYAGPKPKPTGGARLGTCKRCDTALHRPRGRFSFCSVACAHAHKGIAA